MATLPQIESGRVQLANVPGAQLPAINVPQIDMVGSRAQAQQANTLSQLLDRMSQSAFGDAAKMQERAGVQFAAENPPTAQQLELAKNGDMSWLGAPSGSQNVFDMALRKARSLELASHFEAEGRTKLTELLNQVEEGKISSDVVSTKIKTMTDGLAKSLAPVDADASLKFRASMATYGHTVLKASLDAEQKRAKEQRLIKFDADFDAAVRLLEPAISQGFWIDPKTGEKQSVDVLVDQYRNSIATGAMLLGDANVQRTYSEKFENAQKQVKVNAVSRFVTDPEFSADPEKGLAMIRSGNVGKMTDVYKALPYDDQAKVMANYMVSINQRETLVKQKQAEEKRNGEVKLVGLMQNLYSSAPGSQAYLKARGDITELAKTTVGVVSDAMIKEMFEPKQPKSDPMVEFNVVSGILNGTITTADQVKSYIGRGLTGNDAVGALKLITSENRRDQSEIERGINRLAGINQTGGLIVLDKNAMEFTNRQSLKAQSLDIESRLLREGKQPTPAMILTELEKFVTDKRSTETAKQATDALKVYEKKDWINGPVTMDSLAALERKAGTDRAKQNDVKRIRGLLQQQNGLSQ